MATTAAALIARARRNIQHHFFSEDAVRPNRAVPFTAHSLIEERQFERLRRRDIIREAKPGQYWIDVVAYDVDLTTRHERLKIILLIVVILLVGSIIATAVLK
jgi:hypothetical protein